MDSRKVLATVLGAAFVGLFTKGILTVKKRKANEEQVIVVEAEENDEQ